MKITFEEACVQAQKYLAKARAFLDYEAPYVSSVTYGLIPEPVRDIDTMGVTEGMVLYYDPFWILNDPEVSTITDAHKVLAACLYHENWHILRDLKRLKALPNGELANIAADLIINHDLTEAGWKLPSWVLSYEKMEEQLGVKVPRGKTVEQLYKFLEKHWPKIKSMQGGGPGGKGGTKGGKGKGGFGQGKRGPGTGTCGGIAGNSVNRELEKALDQKYGRDDGDQKHIKETAYEKIKEQLARKGRGSAPGFYEQDLKFEKEVIRVDWARELKYVAKRTTGRVLPGGEDYSIRRPSKRSALLGVVRPGLIDQMCVPGFVRDTSGSMGDAQLNSANNVIIDVMASLGVDRVWLLDADTKVHGKPKLVRVKDIPHLKAKGRGGTSFIKALQAVENLRPRPDVCFYLTDGDGTAPASPPPFPVIWCIVPTPYGTRPAKWGHVVVCDESQQLWDQYAEEEEEVA